MSPVRGLTGILQKFMMKNVMSKSSAKPKRMTVLLPWLLNNCDKYILFLIYHDSIKFVYPMIIIILLVSRNQSPISNSKQRVYAINLASRKIICEFVNFEN